MIHVIWALMLPVNCQLLISTVSVATLVNSNNSNWPLFSTTASVMPCRFGVPGVGDASISGPRVGVAPAAGVCTGLAPTWIVCPLLAARIIVPALSSQIGVGEQEYPGVVG